MVTTFTEYEDLADHMSATAPDAVALSKITAELGDEYHQVWLDGPTVWHAWQEDPCRPGSAWVLNRESALEALVWLREQLCLVMDRLADPSLYEDIPADTVERDEDVLEELYDVELAAIPTTDPRDVDLVIQKQIRDARAEVARLAGLRVHHIVDRIGGTQERGWQTRAARTLGVTEATVSGLLTAERERQNRRRSTRATY